jgi:hypothetical protein
VPDIGFRNYHLITFSKRYDRYHGAERNAKNVHLPFGHAENKPARKGDRRQFFKQRFQPRNAGSFSIRHWEKIALVWPNIIPYKSFERPDPNQESLPHFPTRF